LRERKDGRFRRLIIKVSLSAATLSASRKDFVAEITFDSREFSDGESAGSKNLCRDSFG
jgi:hypothetical protein